MNLTGQPIRQKGSKPVRSKPDGKDAAYLSAIHTMPCWICAEWGMTQLSPTQAHHTIHGRYGNRKTPDRQAIPLCEGHHQGLRDTSKIALHREPERWKAEYGLDTDWIARTQDNITCRGDV